MVSRTPRAKTRALRDSLYGHGFRLHCVCDPGDVSGWTLQMARVDSEGFFISKLRKRCGRGVGFMVRECGRARVLSDGSRSLLCALGVPWVGGWTDRQTDGAFCLQRG